MYILELATEVIMVQLYTYWFKIVGHIIVILHNAYGMLFFNMFLNPIDGPDF